MNNVVFGKTMEDITKKEISNLQQPKQEGIIYCQNQSIIQKKSEKSAAIEMKKAKIFMNQSVYLGLSMLQISEIVMYEFLYGYVKPKYG